MNDSAQGMKSEYHGPSGPGGYWFHLYECQHISKGEYPAGLAIPLGPNVNLLVCRHCWAGIKGMVAEELLHHHLWHLPQTQRETVVKQLIEQGNQGIDEEQARFKAPLQDDEDAQKAGRQWSEWGECPPRI